MNHKEKFLHHKELICSAA